MEERKIDYRFFNRVKPLVKLLSPEEVDLGKRPQSVEARRYKVNHLKFINKWKLELLKKLWTSRSLRTNVKKL